VFNFPWGQRAAGSYEERKAEEESFFIKDKSCLFFVILSALQA
jgi:hypothetical protein